MTTAVTTVVIDEPAGSRRGTLSCDLRDNLRSELTLAALPSAVGAARLFVRHTFTKWHIDDGGAERMGNATQALVTHAVATTGVMSSAPFHRDVFDRLQLIVVRLRLTPGLLVSEVWDRTEASPDARLEEDAAVRATDEHAYAVPLPGRRVVWCAVRLRPQPRGMPRAAQLCRPPAVNLSLATDSATGQAAEPTADLLRRVLAGLREVKSDPP